jgi:hypothetical protein
METSENIMSATGYVSHAFYVSPNTFLSSGVTVFSNFSNIMRLKFIPTSSLKQVGGLYMTLQYIVNDF